MLKTTPYDRRPSEKVLVPALAQATATAVACLTRGVRDRISLTLASCTAATLVLGYVVKDARLEVLKDIALSRHAAGSDGDDGDQPTEKPAEIGPEDEHPGD
jgi:hypothetical protein